MATALLKSLDVRSTTFCPCLKKGAFPCFPRLPLSFFLMSTLLRLCLPSSLLAGDPDWSEDHAERNANWSKNQKMQDYTLHTTLKLEDNVVVCYGYPTPPLFVVVPLVVVALPLFAAVPLVVVALPLFAAVPLVVVAPLLFGVAPLVVVAPLDAGVPPLFVAPLDAGAPCVAHHRCCPGIHLCWPFAVSLFPAAASSGRCPAHTKNNMLPDMWTSSGCNAVLWSCCSFCSSSRFSSCRFCRSFHQSSFTFTWLMDQHNYASQKHQQTLTIKSLWLENTDFFSTYGLWEWNLKTNGPSPDDLRQALCPEPNWDNCSGIAWQIQGHLSPTSVNSYGASWSKWSRWPSWSLVHNTLDALKRNIFPRWVADVKGN